MRLFLGRSMKLFSWLWFSFFLFGICNPGFSQSSDSTFNFVYVSDSHYGIHRDTFRGDTHVISGVVNQAIVTAINTLPRIFFPSDSGVSAGKAISFIEFVINGGDIANRMQGDVQSASSSWNEFERDYIDGLHIMADSVRKSSLYYIPGNHDVSNAIGHRKFTGGTDPTAMVKIYNAMLKPDSLISNERFRYKDTKVHFSFQKYGVHFQFVNMWPDSAERVWMRADLDTVPEFTPVILITHDEPEVEAKHFTNPKWPHDINKSHSFENLLEQRYRGNGNTDLQQKEFVAFLKEYPQVKAYFHGNSNWNEFYDYKGPDREISLPTFRVDSPMKGEKSQDDETLLSFMVVSVDIKNRKLTARECLYNQPAENGTYILKFGSLRTIDL